MTTDFQQIFRSCFEKLYGLPAWQVRPGHGSFLTMEFGNPHLEIRDPRPSPRLKNRLVTIHGDWHLWIYCCDWQVFANGKAIGDASLKSSSKEKIIKAAEYLDGQKLVHASMSELGCILALDFDLGGQLTTKPYDKKSEQWFLYEPQDTCLVARADRKFSYGPSDSSETTWVKVEP